MAWGLQFNGTSTEASFTGFSTSGEFAFSGEFVTGTLADHGLVMGLSTGSANFIGDVQGAGFYARIANVDSSGQALPIANSTRYTWSVTRDVSNLVTVTLDGVGSYTFTAAGVANFDTLGRNNFGFYFDGQLISSEVSLAGVPTYSWSSTASDHSNTGVQPIILDTISNNDATGVNFATDGTDWVDLGGVSDSIALSPFSTTGRYIFNRELNNSDRSISVTVTPTGDYSGGIQWRLVDEATGLPITGYDWSTLIATPIAGANTTQVSVPTSTGMIWYKIQVRFTASIGINDESVNEFAVGALVVDNGQSNCLRRDVITDTPPALNANASQCTTSGWQPTFTTGNGAIAKVNELATLLNMPIGYYNNGENSAPISYFDTGAGWTRLSSLITNYFDNFFEFMCFDQGERDAILGTSTVVYQAAYQSIYDKLLAQMGRTQAELTFCVNMGGNSNGYDVNYTDLTLEAVRQGKRDFVAANTGAIFGGHRIDLPLADTIHNDAASYEIAAAREVKSYAVQLGLGTVTGDGREMTSANLTGTTLTITYSAGDALNKVGSGAATITQISDDGFSTLLTITGTTVNADTVVHTLSTTPVGDVDIRDYYGIDLDVSTRPNLVSTSFVQSTSISSTLNLTATGYPDGTYSAELYQATAPLTYIKTENITFTGGSGTSTILLAAGTTVYTRIDGATPPATGVTCYGDTV